ncbi:MULTISPECIES: DUF2147 domain-containing protein [unclassified Bradyrhizobium]|uniref:DUF2147 domain-containing protein n=1 Tax=unclassified Bradyrhizobium TaxID=2631580 RepID=UPI0028EA1548|nr:MULTISPECIES: DUF2147 domain-containing protein [unclassified Bradyrhizobium]
MKRLLAVAAVVLASSAAHAQYVIEYGGKTIRIDPDRGTVQIPGVYDNTEQKKTKRTKRDQDSAAKPQPGSDKQAPAEAAVTPAPPAQAPAVVAPAPMAPAPTAVAPTSPPPAPAPVAPAPVQAAAPPTPPPAAAPVAPAEPAAKTAAPAAPPAAASAAAAPAAAPAPVAASPRPAQAPPAVTTAAAPPTAPPPAARDPNSPVGIWLTEEKEGKIRIEPCGTNLCGYAVDAKTNQNGEQILINMRPSDKTQEKKWSGRIFDPNSGSTYDSTIALKGSDSLRVQGCAFGGMFCGGQTWTRVN